MAQHNRCRVCEAPLPEPFLDLGVIPLANAFLSHPAEFEKEPAFPLATALCERCGLIQLNFVVPPEVLYRHYLYVSSTSEAVRRHAEALAAQTFARKRLAAGELAVELGSNDGLVLRAFRARGARVLGVEPAENIAETARANGIPTLNRFFRAETARAVRQSEGPAALLLGRHVFAHLDDWNDFFRGVDALLAPGGTLLIEVPYLGNLLENLEFDTIYHEHLSYVSLEPVAVLSERHGFRLVDVDPVPLHGGSVVLSIRRKSAGEGESDRLKEMRAAEKRAALKSPATWKRFADSVHAWRGRFEAFMESQADGRSRWIGYGAAAKANTLLNFAPAAARHLEGVLDRNPLKVGKFTPGTHLPVLPVEAAAGNGADRMLILAWNFREEIVRQMRPFAERGGRFAVPIPEPALL